MKEPWEIDIDMRGPENSRRCERENRIRTAIFVGVNVLILTFFALVVLGVVVEIVLHW